MERKPFKRQNRKRMKVAAGKRMDADNQTAQQRTYDNRAPSRLSITVPASVLVALVERSEKEGCSISHLATCLLKQSLIQGDVTPFIGPGLMRVGGCGHAAAPC